MLAYAANRPDPAGRRSSPNVMLFILAAHIAAIAALMSAKMDAVGPFHEPPIVVHLWRDPPPPPPENVKPTQPTPQPPTNHWITHPTPKTPTEPVRQPPVELGGPINSDPGPIGGSSTGFPPKPPVPLPVPVHVGPTLLTPPSALRPPYPESKLLNEEEADLRLRLTISPDGRVTAVDPIGRADAVFLDAARRYLIAHWRYRPATVDGRAVATTAIITLSFRLDG